MWLINALYGIWLLSANVTHGLIDPVIDAYGPSASRGYDMQHLGFGAHFPGANHSLLPMGPRSGTTTCTTPPAHAFSNAPIAGIQRSAHVTIHSGR